MAGRRRNAAEVVLVEGREISISNPGKVLFPEPGYTKLDLVRYYLAVAEGALRGAGGRPTVLVRYPDGIDRRILLPEAGAGLASAVDRGGVPALSIGTKRGGSGATRRRGARVAREPGLPRAAPASVRAEDLDHPDELRVDLDPVPGVTWPQIRQVAHVVDATLRDFGLTGWPKTSGSRGVHVNVRIERRWSFDEVRRAALALAREVERRAPDIATSKWWKEERHGVFVDYNQNAKDRTVASAYSVRPTPDARVSAPVSWDELDRCDPGDFTLRTMPARFAEIGDRHAGIDETRGRSTRSSSSRLGRSAMGWATPPGLRTTRSRPMSPRAWRHRGAACRSTRSSRSGAPGARRTRWPGSSAGRRAIPKRPPISRLWMSSWTRCADGRPPGRASE